MSLLLTEAVAPGPQSAPGETPLWLPTGTTDLSPLAAWLAGAKGRFALDTETTGLDPLADGFECKQLALGCSDGTSVVVDGADAVFVRTVLRLVTAGGRRWYAHNAAYDASVLWAVYGVRLDGLVDTLTAARCAWPGRHTYTLKALRPETEARLAELRSHWEEVSGHKLGKQTDKTWLPRAIAGLLPSDPWVLRYVAADAVECARLADEIGRLPKRAGQDGQSQRSVLAEVHQDLLWRHVELDGIGVDRAGLIAKQAAAEEVIAEAEAHWGLDLSANSHAVRKWVADLGIVCRDKAGKDTLSSDAWESAVVPEAAAPAWGEFQRVRNISADLNKIGEILEKSARDGRIYPSVGVNAADQTGRMSVRGPAVQNLTAELRGFLLADEGKTLVGLDLDQVEPRVAAGLSGDKKMAEAISSGDVYMAAAAVIWRAPHKDDDERAWRRKTAKTTLLAQIYGQGARSLAARLGVSQTESLRICSTLLSAWSGLREWMGSVRSDAERGRPVLTWSGRLLPPCADAPYKAVNYTVQGSAADIFKAMVTRVAKGLGDFPGARLWLPVHDELVVECGEDDAEEVAKMLGETMRLDIGGIPVGGAPAVLGPRWVHA